MASFDAAFAKYFGPRITRFEKDTTEEEIIEVYRDWAPEYNKAALQSAKLVYHKPLAAFLDGALRQVFQGKEKSQIKIIDAGAGTGLNGVELSKLGYTNIDAIDISQAMLDEANKTNAFTKLICASLNEHNPEIETGEYHALITAGVLVIGHVRPEALDEMIRMVKIGGLFCFPMRDLDLNVYQGKLLELEKTGKWQTFTKKRMPLFDNEELPRETNTFIYKVLNH